MLSSFAAHLSSASGRVRAQGCLCAWGQAQVFAHLSLGEAGSCLMMGKSGSLSTPCSCFSLYSF